MREPKLWELAVVTASDLRLSCRDPMVLLCTVLLVRFSFELRQDNHETKYQPYKGVT